MTEDDVTQQCDALAKAAGWSVESYSDKRKVRTHPGLPDRRYVHVGRALTIWIELKAPRGKLTQEQHAWLLAESAAGGLATVVDDVAQLQWLFNALARRLGRQSALEQCKAWIALTAQRGYRRAAA